MATDRTTLLALPYIAAAQAQKHVTHNDALRILDGLVQLAVKSASTAAPPASPAEGDRYIVPAGASGVFAGQVNRIALFQDGGWVTYAPNAGWISYVLDAAALRYFDGSAWQAVSSVPASVPLLGINATADTTNRLAVSAAATLLNNAGNGHQLKLNKAAASDTASLLYQTGFSGRAEMGLTGDDAFHVKVSPDGATWREAVMIDRASGVVSFPQGTAGPAINPNLLINGDFQINQRGFAGGSLAAGLYGFDRWKGGASGATLTRSGLALTLSAGGIAQPIEPALFGEASFAGRSLTLSVAGLSGGSLAIGFGSASGTLATGATSLTLVTSASDTGTLSLTVSVASGTPVVSRLKLEIGSLATGWSARPLPHELALCQRYYETSAPAGQIPASYAPGGGSNSIFANSSTTTGSVTTLRYLVPKRIAPTLTIRDGLAAAGKISVYDTAWRNGFAYSNILGATDKGFSLQQVNSGVAYVTFEYAADAEV